MLFKFIGIDFIGLLYDLATASIISSHATAKSPIMLSKYLSFSQVNVLAL